jgi:hypothetical protein
VNSAFSLCGIAGAIAMRLILQRANKKLDEGQTGVEGVMKGRSSAAVVGVTEDERIALQEGFRYIL